MKLLTLNGKKMKEIGNKTPTAEVLATSLSLRQRTRHEINVDRTRMRLIREGEKITEKDYMQFWSDLQAENLGHIVLGRMGNYNRFIFHYDPIKIGKACLQGTDEQASEITPTTRRRAHNRRTTPLRVSRTTPLRFTLDLPPTMDAAALKLILDTVKRYA